LRAGETLLVVGGASAVGTAMVQFGTAAGADVTAPSVGEISEATKRVLARIVLAKRASWRPARCGSWVRRDDVKQG
jgi:NADPH:quinone reductase-like Zn-dependent oxidoreductase